MPEDLEQLKAIIGAHQGVVTKLRNQGDEKRVRKK